MGDETRNPDYVGDARRAERVARGPVVTERVWDYVCDNSACPKPKAKPDGTAIKQRTKPVGTPPAKNCDGCGEYNWRKLPGERIRAKDAAPQAAPAAPHKP